LSTAAECYETEAIVYLSEL